MSAVILLYVGVAATIGPSILMLIACATSPIRRLFGFKLEKVVNQIHEDKYSQTIAHIKKETWLRTTENDDLLGWATGKWFIAHVTHEYGDHNSSRKTIWILTREIPSDPSGSIIFDEETHKKITTWKREGNYFHLEYRRVSEFAPTQPFASQKVSVDSIVEWYRIAGNVTILLWGGPGTGKSATADLVASRLGGSVCREYNPTDPGGQLIKLYSEAAPAKDEPLILLLDEFDILVRAVHEGTVIKHRHVPVPVYDKSTLNRFMDGLSKMPWLIVIMSMNCDPKKIDALDSSYLRKGRVDHRIHLQALADGTIADVMHEKKYHDVRIDINALPGDNNEKDKLV